MTIKGVIKRIEDDGCYVIFVIAVEGLTWQVSAGFSPHDSEFYVGNEVVLDVKVDSVTSLIKLDESPILDSYIVQNEGVSVEIVAWVSQVSFKDEIVVDIPEFGQIEVSLEYDCDIQVGQWIKFRGCLSRK